MVTSLKYTCVNTNIFVDIFSDTAASVISPYADTFTYLRIIKHPTERVELCFLRAIDKSKQNFKTLYFLLFACLNHFLL